MGPVGRGPKTPKLALSMKTSLHTVTERTGPDNLPKDSIPHKYPSKPFSNSPNLKTETHDRKIKERLYAGALEVSAIEPEMSCAAWGVSDSPGEGTVSFEEAPSSAVKHMVDISY